MIEKDEIEGLKREIQDLTHEIDLLKGIVQIENLHGIKHRIEEINKDIVRRFIEFGNDYTPMQVTNDVLQMITSLKNKMEDSLLLPAIVSHGNDHSLINEQITRHEAALESSEFITKELEKELTNLKTEMIENIRNGDIMVYEILEKEIAKLNDFVRLGVDSRVSLVEKNLRQEIECMDCDGKAVIRINSTFYPCSNLCLSCFIKWLNQNNKEVIILNYEILEDGNNGTI